MQAQQGSPVRGNQYQQPQYENYSRSPGKQPYSTYVADRGPFLLFQYMTFLQFFQIVALRPLTYFYRIVIDQTLECSILAYLKIICNAKFSEKQVSQILQNYSSEISCGGTLCRGECLKQGVEQVDEARICQVTQYITVQIS